MHLIVDYIKMVDITSLLSICAILTIILSNATGQTSVSQTKTTTVVVTAPLPEVDQGDILSIHCEVSHMKVGQEVVILKKTHDGVIKISSEDTILVEDDRIFVAKRPLQNGGMVYFLSIIDVLLEDDGEYYCKVTENTEVGGTLDVAIESVPVGILHFPTDPVCTAPMPLRIHEGAWVAFNCSAGPANPAVSMKWTVSGKSLAHMETKSEEYTYSVLRFKVERKDHNAMYLCSIGSKAFPGRVKTCHVGPIHVIAGGGGIDEPDLIDTPSLSDTPKLPPDHNTENDNIDMTESETIRCKVECDLFSSDVFYWIVSTVVISVIAFIFFVFGMILIIKYCRLNSIPTTRYSLPSQHPEQIYSEVEARRGEVKEYMALMKPAAKSSIIMVQRERDHGRFEEHLAH